MPSTHASASGQFSHRMRVCLFIPSDATPMRMPPLSIPVSSSIVAIILSSIRGACDQYWEVLGLYRKREGQCACTSTVCSRAFDTTT